MHPGFERLGQLDPAFLGGEQSLQGLLGRTVAGALHQDLLVPLDRIRRVVEPMLRDLRQIFEHGHAVVSFRDFQLPLQHVADVFPLFETAKQHLQLSECPRIVGTIGQHVLVDRHRVFGALELVDQKVRQSIPKFPALVRIGRDSGASSQGISQRLGVGGGASK